MGEYGDLDLADELMALRAENARLRKLAIEETSKLRDENARLQNEIIDLKNFYNATVLHYENKKKGKSDD